jgi:hypothetical protein
MPHYLPEYQYIVGFVLGIIGIFLVFHFLAAARGYREK